MRRLLTVCLTAAAMAVQPATVGAQDDAGIIDRAIAQATDAIRADPDDYSAYIMARPGPNGFGRRSRRRSSTSTGASTAPVERIRKNPEVVSPYLWRGLAHQAKAEYDHAITDLDQAIRLNPRNWEAYNNRDTVSGTRRKPMIRPSSTAKRGEASVLIRRKHAAYVNRGNAWLGKRGVRQRHRRLRRGHPPRARPWQRHT